jgi:uncharacterized protein YsxB (DUF464 family)
MIEIGYNEDLGAVRAEGHARYGKKGEDIVCAAVSALLHVLGNEALKKLGGKATDEDGVMEIYGYGFRYLAVFRAVIEGLKEIAAQYPDNVAVTEELEETGGTEWRQ